MDALKDAREQIRGEEVINFAELGDKETYRIVVKVLAQMRYRY